jgi:hypothetical protein
MKVTRVDVPNHRLILSVKSWRAEQDDIALAEWTDGTDQISPPFTGLLRRVNPVPNVPQRFYRATFPAGTAARVQLAALVHEQTENDSALGGDLFDWIPLEHPGAAPPAMYTTAGTSAVCDMLVADEGHYTVQCYRPNGGSVILHVDAEFG